MLYVNENLNFTHLVMLKELLNLFKMTSNSRVFQTIKMIKNCFKKCCLYPTPSKKEQKCDISTHYARSEREIYRFFFRFLKLKREHNFDSNFSGCASSLYIAAFCWLNNEFRSKDQYTSTHIKTKCNQEEFSFEILPISYRSKENIDNWLIKSLSIIW